MSEDTFRLVITAAVLVACVAFVVQSVVILALYRSARKVQEKVEGLGTTVEPLVAKIGPVFDKVGPILDRAGPVVERIGPILDRTAHTMEQMGPAIEKVIGQIGGVVKQVGPVVEEVRHVVVSVNQVVTDSRPRIADFSDEAVSAARWAREQAEHVGDLIEDVSGRARARIEQIDHSVESTVDQVGQVGDSMKRAVLRPVREANGIAAGISAAVSTLVRPRKSSPDAATQDEEMFI